MYMSHVHVHEVLNQPRNMACGKLRCRVGDSRVETSCGDWHDAIASPRA